MVMRRAPQAVWDHVGHPEGAIEHALTQLAWQAMPTRLPMFSTT